MQPGFFGFEHSYLSRAGSKTRGKSGPLHLSSVASYMSNARKVGKAIAVNLPTDRGALYSELNRHSASITRKNGRIAETFTINFDARMSPEHMDAALHRFLLAVTFQGKTRAEGWRHVDHDHNPHAHVLLIDVDANGEPVAHFSRSATYRRENSPVKGNPTTWLRQVWQDECNTVLQEHGYDFRLDRRSKLEQGTAKQMAANQSEVILDMVIGDRGAAAVEPEQTADSGHSIDRGEEAECPPMPGDAPEAEDYPDPTEDVADEDEMAENETHDMPAPGRVRFAVQAFHNLSYLKQTQAKVSYHSSQLAHASKHLLEAEAAGPKFTMAKMHAEMAVSFAREELAKYQKSNGKLKGFDLKIWKSPARVKGEEAALNVHSVEAQFEIANRAYAEAQADISRWQSSVESHANDRDSATATLRQIEASMGDARDLEQAEEMMTEAIYDALDGLSVTDMLQMVQDGQITEAEYHDALHALGTDEAKQALRELEREDGQSLQ